MRDDRRPMKNWILRAPLLLMLFFLLMSSRASSPKPSSLEEPVSTPFILQLISDPEVKEVQEAAFMIKAKHHRRVSAGTGMAVERDRILTAFHLVGDPYTGEITAEEIWVSQPHTDWKGEISAEVVRADPSVDVAVLKVKPFREVPPLSFGDPDQLRPGELIYLIGHEVFLLDGIGILYPRDGEIMGDFTSEESTFLVISPPVARGFSGGGVFNQKHELVGIISRNSLFPKTVKEGGRVYRMVKQGAIATKIHCALPLLE
ncbi:MAG TPA: serine protease [Anaerolineae bacterium]|nr:serine protease [Anaerolineae bacterium]